MSLSVARRYYLPAIVIVLLAVVCLSNLSVFSLYSTGKTVSSCVQSNDGKCDFGRSSINTTISKIETTTTSPPLYPPSPVQNAEPVTKDYDDYWLVASPQREVMVTIIPKVMCSSIRSAMNKIECSNPASPKYNNRCAEARWSKELREDFRSFSNFTRVVFYRDPIERALSTYYNSESNRYLVVDGCDTWKNCTFDYWVQQLVSYQNVTQRKRAGGKKWNEHFMKQSVISQQQKMHYHYRLRMTNKDHTIFFFEHLLKTKPMLANQSSNSKSKTPTANSPISSSATMNGTKDYVANKFEQVSKDALAQLLVIYEDDFELWEDIVASAPRGQTEYTMYDYYKEHLEEEMRPEVERIKKEMGKKAT